MVLTVTDVAAVIIFTVVLTVGMARRVRRAEAQKKNERVARAAQKLKDQRFNLGGRICNAITLAVSENPKKAEFNVWTLRNNGGAYSVIVDWHAPNANRVTVFQVDVKYSGSTGTELTVFWPGSRPCSKHSADETTVWQLIPQFAELMRTYAVK